MMDDDEMGMFAFSVLVLHVSALGCASYYQFEQINFNLCRPLSRMDTSPFLSSKTRNIQAPSLRPRVLFRAPFWNTAATHFQEARNKRMPSRRSQVSV